MANNKKIKGLTVEIGGDSTKLGKALDDSKKKSKSLQTELRQVERLLKMDPGNVELLAQKQKILTDRVDETRKCLTLMKEEQEKVNQLYKNGEIGEADYRKYQREVEQTRLDLEKLEGQLKETDSQFAHATQDINGINLGEAERKVAGFGDSVKDMADTSMTKLDNLSDKFNNVGNKLESAGIAINTAVSSKVAQKLSEGVTDAMDFEDAMAKVSTIADENEVPMDKMREQILALSNETGIAATDIAENVYNAISAGQKTGDAVNFVAKSLSLSKAGFADTGAALDVLTTIMNAYGMSAEEIGNISDMLIQTQNLGKVTVGELASSMGKVIPTANQYGVSLDQLAAAYSVTTAKGIAAAESTTYINSMLNELGKADGKASKALKEGTGKTFTELMGEGKSLSDVLAILQENAVKNNLSLGDMFGSAEAAKAASTLLGDSASVFNDRLKEMNSSTGATDKALGKLKTTSTETKKNVNELKNAGIDLGDEVLKQAAPLLKDVMGGVKNLTDWLKKLKPEQKEQLTKALEIIAVIGPGVTILGKLTKGVGSLIGVVPKLTKGMIGLNAAMDANPVGAVTLAITAFIGVIGGAIAAINALNDAKLADLGFTEQLSVVNDSAEKIRGIKDEIKETQDAIKNSMKDSATEIGVIDDYKGRLDELLKKSDWSSTEVQELKTIGQYFSENSPEFQKAWDNYIEIDDKGQLRLKGNAEQIKKNLDGIIEKYKQVAATEALTDISKQNREGAVKYREKASEAIQGQILAQEKLDEFLKEWGLNDSAKLEEVYSLMDHVPVSNAAGTESVSAENLRNQYEALVETVGKSAADLDTILTETAQFDVNAKDINRMLSVVGGNLDDAAAVYMTFLQGYIDESAIRKSQYKTIDQLRREAEKQSKANNENMAYGSKKGIENYKPNITKSSLEKAKIYLQEYEKVAENEVKNYVAAPGGIITKLTESDYITAKERYAANAANYRSLLEQLNNGVGGVTQEMVDNAEKAMISSQNNYAAAATIAEVSSDEIKQTISDLNRDGAYIAANDTAFQEAFKKKMAQVTEAVKEEKEPFKSAMGNTLASGRQEFDPQKPDYRQGGKDLTQETQKGMESVDLKETGGNVVLGFLKGMWNNSIYAKIVEVVGNINNSLYEAFKSWWGIHSPADKHAPFVGKNIVLGVLKKMGSMKREIKATGDEVNEAIYQSLTPDKARLSELLSMENAIIPPTFAPSYSRGIDRSELITLSSKMDILIDKMDAIAQKEQGIYLDGNILVGRTVERMDDALYRRAVNRERGV